MARASSTVLPRVPESVRNANPDLYEYLNRLIQQLEAITTQANFPKGSGWQPTNIPASGNRSIDADVATLQETSRSLARLIGDLRDAGTLSA